MAFGGDNRVGLGAGIVSLATLSSRATSAPRLSLNFLSGNLDPRITFTRASTATFVGNNGLIQTAAIDAPRFDYNPSTLAAKGLLIEEQRTNLLTYSEQFDNPAWFAGAAGAAVVTANTATDPTGNASADTLDDNSGVAVLGRQNGAPITSGTNSYTATVFIKTNTSPCASMRITLSGGTPVVAELVMDTINGAAQWRTATTGASFSVTPFGNGWFRFSATVTDNNSGNNVFVVELRPAFAATYTPTISAAATGSIYVWGAQFEAGSFATSYIPTVASQVTRSADVATVTGTNFSSWYNQNAGTMVCEFAPEGLTTGGAVSNVWVVNASATPSTNFTQLREGTVISGADAEMFAGGASQVDTSSFALAANVAAKSAFAWATNSGMLAANGALIGAEDTSVTPPTVNQLVLTGGNKWLRQIAFYNSRLPNAQLRALTI